MTPEEQLKVTNETLYKHGHELAVKNKVLSFLGRLYEISTLTLTQRQLAEQVAVALQTEFDFEMVGIFQYNQSVDELFPLSVVLSERVRAIAPVAFNTVAFPHATKNEFLSSIITKKAMFYSELLESVWQQPELKGVCQKIESEKYVRSSLGYPLIIGGQVIGVVLISLNRTYNDLIDYERDSMRNFMNVISITLNRVMLYEELGLANRRQENLIYFITHEVKGYLTKSQAVFSSITEGDFDTIPAPLMTIAERALADTQNGIETVRDILETSNLKKGTTQYDMQECDLKTLILETIKGFAVTLGDKGLSLETHIDDTAYPFNGDKLKLERHLFRNLIDNAIRYTPTGSISISLSRTDTDILFSIKDTGVGIDSVDVPHLFTEGGRAKDSTKINVDSTGYGLFVAKMVVEAHQGKIWVESEGKGYGSTFFVILPLVK